MLVQKRYLVALIGLLFSLSGCVGTVVKDVKEDVETVRQGPDDLPVRNITDFSDSLICMDNLFMVYGYAPNEIVMLLEEIKDKTKKVDAGTREMVISAISDMTRRSQVVQLIAFGNDSGNLLTFLERAEVKALYDIVPPYDIIGSVTQLDKDVVRKQQDAGAEFGGTVDGHTVGGGIGLSASASGTVLGLDLSVVRTSNVSVIAGVTTRNSAVIYKIGDSKEFDAGISKTGVNFSINNLRNDGTTQALRALVELSVIELVGKLLKIPYWKCLGLDPESEEIRREVSDWFFQMTQAGTLIQNMKIQLYLRGYYNGGIDGNIDAEFQRAVMEYKERLGLPLDPGVDSTFYDAFLNTSPDSIPMSRLAYLKIKKEAKPGASPQQSSGRMEVVAAQPKPEPRPQTVEKPIGIEIESTSGSNSFQAGEEIALTVRSNTNGFLACYMQLGEKGDYFTKILPNRFSANGFISKKGAVQIPGTTAYSLTADNDQERVFCFVTTRNVGTDLPDAIRRPDFEQLAVNSIEEISSAYEKATSGRFGMATFEITIR